MTEENIKKGGGVTKNRLLPFVFKVSCSRRYFRKRCLMLFWAMVGEEINRRSKNYKIGGLQELRKIIKKQSRLASRRIFDRRTIFENWAWHYGGRTELQFNIGVEDDFLRYGVAFSLECCQSLPSIDVLVPKMARFNEF